MIIEQVGEFVISPTKPENTEMSIKGIGGFIKKYKNI